MPETAAKPSVPPPNKLTVRIAGLILLLIFAAALFGDVLVWAAYGTKFVLSPRYKNIEGWLRDLIGVSWIGFLIFEKGAEHLQKNRWKPFLFGMLTVIVGSIPLAKPGALLVHFVIVKGTPALAQPKIAWLVALFLLVFACKCKTIGSVWNLLLLSKPQDPRRIVISD